MFGYVKPRVSELLVKEFELYKATYCGLCAEGGRKVSRLTRFLLNDDFVFLCLIRMAVTGVEPKAVKKRCPYKLCKKNVLVDNECITYSCAAFGMLAYHKVLDDIADTKGVKKLFKKITLPYFRHINKKANKLYPELESVITESLAKLSETEKKGGCSIDEAAWSFADLTGKLCAYGTEGANNRILYQCGFHLGRYIYLIDAFDDALEDESKNEYNCFTELFGSAEKTYENENTVGITLKDSMNELCAAFALADDVGYNRLIQNIAVFGSDDAFRAVVSKHKGKTK